MITNTSMAAVHGYLCGDGCVISGQYKKSKYYVVDFRNTSAELLVDFQKKYFELFQETPIINKKVTRCKKGSKRTYLYLIDSFGSFHSRKWCVPNMTVKCSSFWLRAFFDCEGWVVCIPSKNRGIGIESVNKDGLLNVSYELSRLGIITSEVKKKENRDIFSFHIWGFDNLVLFEKKVGFLHPQKKLKLRCTIEDYSSWRWNFDKKTVIELLRKKAKCSKNRVRIFSREQNLVSLSKELEEKFSIKPVISERKNGRGTKYFELSIYGSDNIKKIKEIIA